MLLRPGGCLLVMSDHMYEMNVAHVCCIFSLSSPRCRSRCWVPHTCLCSCTQGRTHLQAMGLHCHFAHTHARTHCTHRHTAGWLLTPLTPLPRVAFRAGAHVVPHALASVLTGGVAHGCKRQSKTFSILWFGFFFYCSN